MFLFTRNGLSTNYKLGCLVERALFELLFSLKKIKSKDLSYRKRWNTNKANIKRDKKTVIVYISVPVVESKRESEQGTLTAFRLLLACHYEFIFTCKMTHKVR